LLVEQGYDPAMGARPLRRAIQRYIEDPLADFVLRSQLEPGATVMVDALEDGKEPDEGEDPIKLSIVQPKKVPAAVGAPEAEAASEEEDTGPDVPALDDAPPPSQDEPDNA
jgi:ATP-dependent Clp protease ATP-binding subunit ClpC